MNKQTPQHVREAFEQYVRSYNAHDDHLYWACFHLPYTIICGDTLVRHAQPECQLDEIKAREGWAYQQIISLQVVAYSAYTAHVIVRLVGLNDQKKLMHEHDMVYIYKKIDGAWKIYVVSQASNAYADAHVHTKGVDG